MDASRLPKRKADRQALILGPYVTIGYLWESTAPLEHIHSLVLQEDLVLSFRYPRHCWAQRVQRKWLIAAQAMAV